MSNRTAMDGGFHMAVRPRHCLAGLLALAACRANAAERVLVQDGKAASCIVLPGNGGPVEAHAASELALFLGKVSGARVEVRNTPSAFSTVSTGS